MNRTALSMIFGALAMTAGAAQAADFYLCAAPTTQTMPDGAVVPMWGFAQDDNSDLTDGCGTGTVQIPGPALNVSATDAGPINIHVLNNLPAGANVSIVIPGQNDTTMTPAFFTDGQGRSRVRSFNTETIPGSVGTYTWNTMTPGTYAYHSGTHVAQQVQMGLYGALTKNAVDAGVGTAAQAYPGVEYDNEVMVFYGEVDAAVHANIVANPAGGVTVAYEPQYFLINGQDNLGTELVAGSAGQRTLIRFINMGLKIHAPTLNGMYMSVVAEDGRAYPYAREQYSIKLEAGATKDAIITPAASGSYAMFDRMMYLTNHFYPVVAPVSVQENPGGLIGFLAVAPAAVDTDGDGVDDSVDNCTLVANALQIDTNGDGFGNACDGDLNNDGIVNFGDFGLFRAALSSQNPDADFNGDGAVNFGDYGIFRTMMGKPPGPAGSLL